MALWHGLQQTVAQGLVRSIGVSNYFAGQIAALEGERPALNQCESSIQGYDNATIGYCQKQGATERGFRGLTILNLLSLFLNPWASSYAPPYRLYGVF